MGYQRYCLMYQQQQHQQHNQQQNNSQLQHQQNNSQQFGYNQQQQLRPKKKEKLLNKRKNGVQMIYIKLERYFLYDDQQKHALSVNLYGVQQALQNQAKIEMVPQIGCYKLTIPASTPLPQRKGYWQNTLKTIRNNIGMSMEHIVQ